MALVLSAFYVTVESQNGSFLPRIIIFIPPPPPPPHRCHHDRHRHHPRLSPLHWPVCPGGCHPVFIVPLAHWCSLPLLATIVLVLGTILVVPILCTLQVLLCLFL